MIAEASHDEGASGRQTQQVMGSTPSKGKWNIFVFFALVTRQYAALSSTTQLSALLRAEYACYGCLSYIIERCRYRFFFSIKIVRFSPIIFQTKWFAIKNCVKNPLSFLQLGKYFLSLQAFIFPRTNFSRTVAFPLSNID